MRYQFAVGLATGLVSATMAGCGGGNGPSVPPPPPTPQIAKASTSGDDQIGVANATLPAPLRVSVTQNGAPVASKEVTWQVQNGGSVNPTTTTTGADGIASTVVTLGNQPIMTITASSSGTGGSPVSFTALAATAAATVQVTNNVFVPQTIAIRAGGRVTFNWPNGSSQHNLIPDDGKDRPNDPVVRNGPITVDVTFPTAGDFFYHCSVHGSTRSGMFGKVVVLP